MNSLILISPSKGEAFNQLFVVKRGFGKKTLVMEERRKRSHWEHLCFVKSIFLL
ncbi:MULTISPECIES: hypothetical protein [unclassified Microcoleus]|uniref:hypothetical protein n=1 Tax=unclassified Microcoleus TaxID=2642155 RepID=UPI0025FFA7C6|nr:MULTISPECIES: hypothetical protein [unclassified Microcoleus]